MMCQEIKSGYRLSTGLESVIVEYLSDTISCADKVRLWKAIGFKEKFALDCNSKPEHIGMVKTILFSYLSDGQEKYLLASTLPEQKIDYNELRIELGLSAEETKSITHKLGDATLETITGRKRGAVSPLLDPGYLDKIDVVYFTRDLMADAVSSPEKRYDLPRSLTVSEFWNAAVLFAILQQKDSKYKTAGNFENECEIIDLAVKTVNQEKAGYHFLFNGTIVKYRGQEYQITNPPMQKIGVSRKRKQLLCTAFPICRDEKGRIKYERDEEHKKMKKQVTLPLSYEFLESALSNLDRR